MDFCEVVNVLTNVNLPHNEVMKFIDDNNLDIHDIIDVVNYITIERNFYKRRCVKLKGGEHEND